MINQTTRTIAFVCVAVVSVAAAAVTHVFTRPPQLAEFSDVGTEFFPEFADPTKATALRVATYSTEKGRADVFDVEFKNGLWRIPSHHNYPADGEEQLARTATSVIGIERGALVSTSKDDHRRLGVVDPLDDSTSGPQGKGDRITLLEGDTVLVDYIIGEKKEDAENTYYVRRADEDRTYLADLDIDISTRFADWIEADLLQLERNKVVEMVADRYTVDESRGVIEKTEVNTIKRPTTTEPWTLEGINEATEKLKTSVVNTMLTALDDMKIVGVRPKPAGLSADLKKNEGIALDLLTESDLAARGFYFHPQLGLISDEGEFRVGTNDGVLYNMRFGSLFTGSDVEIEIGKSDGKEASKKDESDDAPEEDETEESDDAAADEDDAAEDEESGLNKSRYVFITVHFDKSLIGPEPQKPTEPTPPAEQADNGKKGEQATPDPDAEASPEQPDSDDGDGGDDGNSDKAEEAKPDPQAEYEAARTKYEQDLKQYESAKAEYERKLEEGRKRVKELNDRFADWYYVISADLFEDLSVDREDLVEPAEPEQPEPADTSAAPNFPGGPAMTTEPAASDSPAADSPATTPADSKESTGKPEEKPADTPEAETDSPPPADSKPAEPAATDEKQPETDSPGESPVKEEPAPSDSLPQQPSEDSSGENTESDPGGSPESAAESEDES